MQTAVQLYTLREVDEPLPRLVERVGETAFDGVEFAGLGDADQAAVARSLEAAGLAVAGAHVPLDALRAGAADAYRALGCETFVVPYLDASHFESIAAVERTAATLSELASGLDGRLCYHNHDHEFVALDALDGETAFDGLAERTDACFEVDVGWVAAAGYDPAALVDGLAGRVPLVHLKDVDVGTRTPVELGEGDVDVPACAAAARRAGAEWLVYEHDDPEDPLASLERGARVLADLR